MKKTGAVFGLSLIVLLAFTTQLNAIVTMPIELQPAMTAVPIRTVVPNFENPSSTIGGQNMPVSRVTITLNDPVLENNPASELLPVEIFVNLAQIRLVLQLRSQPIGATVETRNATSNMVVAIVPNDKIYLIQEIPVVRTVSVEPIQVPIEATRSNIPPLPLPGTRVPLVPPSFDGNRGQ